MEFKELNNLLIDANAGSLAAECHGFLCGYLSLCNEVREETFKEYLFADVIDRDMLDECNKKLVELATEIIADINNKNFIMELLLPDDNSPLNERGAELVRWCEGYLSGLGIAGLSEFDLLSVECQEIIQDLYKICRLDVNNIADEGEDEESAFMELTEYIRMGAILLYEEFQQTDNARIYQKVLH